MSEIARLSISLDDDLLGKFDQFWRKQKFATRSEAICQLLRDALTKDAWTGASKNAVGTLSLVYDHHHPQLRNRLMKLQHDNPELVVAAMHIHLTHDLCLEVIVLRGPAGQLQEMAAHLRGMKGVHKGELVMANADPF